MPLQATSGAASYDAFGGGVAAEPNYIESCFSTYLYTGNGTDQTITNGIDLAGKGGMVWIKSRNATFGHRLVDSVRTPFNTLNSASTSAEEATLLTAVSAFNSNGFTLANSVGVNGSSYNYASWTFRKQPKFFDVVTYTGDNTAGRTVAHNLGSAPGCIIVKRTDGSGQSWAVYHRSMGNTDYMFLNSTGASATSSGYWNNTSPTATEFTLGTSSDVNYDGLSYVAYLFAHDSGGFGLTGTDNVISCGSFVAPTSGSSTTIDLGYEPQWILTKKATGTSGDWFIQDNMRGITDSNVTYLNPNNSNAEASPAANLSVLTATGFIVKSGFYSAGETVIYIAIRRGPMKVPTSGTSVFSPLALSNTTGTKNTTGFPVDLQINAERNGVHNTFVVDRLRGVITNDTDTASPYLKTNATSAEATDITALTRYWDNTGFMTASYQSGAGTAYWNFRRAPSFFDEVCYTGTGSATTQAHNLGVAPELVIIKQRNSATDWWVLDYPINGSLQLNNSYEVNSPIPTNLTTGATSTTFSLGNYSQVNGSGGTFVAYLFATCAGVSKVGSYTGSDSDLNIDCGFTSGARFVMIKRTDASSDWYVWDSARGIVSGNDPRLSLNTTAAEVTDMNMINTYSAGFSVPAGGPNTGAGATFIYLAIA